jgi:hypothetical protein
MCGRDTSYAKFTEIFCHVSPVSLLGASSGCCQRDLVGKSGMIRTLGENVILSFRSFVFVLSHFTNFRVQTNSYSEIVNFSLR